MVNREGLTLRQAALLAGFGYLLTTPVFFIEFFIYPQLVIRGHIEQTVANIGSHHGLFLAAIFGYLINFIGDIIAAVGLFILLAPVNRAVSLLAAWFRLVYTTVALVGLFNLVTAYRMIITPDYVNAFGSAASHAQIDLLLHSFPAALLLADCQYWLDLYWDFRRTCFHALAVVYGLENP